MTDAALREMLKRRIDFRQGYFQFFEKPFAKWIKSNPSGKLIQRMLQGGLAPLAKRFSNKELIDRLKDLIASLDAEPSPVDRASLNESISVYLVEIEARMGLRKRER